MKHAGPDALSRLAPALAGLRALPQLREKGPGVFYRRSRAFLHFHDDPTGLYADVRAADDTGFDRFKIVDNHQAAFVAQVVARLGQP